MPKIAVNEDGEAATRENEVRTTALTKASM